MPICPVRVRNSIQTPHLDPDNDGGVGRRWIPLVRNADMGYGEGMKRSTAFNIYGLLMPVTWFLACVPCLIWSTPKWLGLLPAIWGPMSFLVAALWYGLLDERANVTTTRSSGSGRSRAARAASTATTD